MAQVDDLFQRLSRWADDDSIWPSIHLSRSRIKQLLPRIGDFRIRLEAPLIVATFGGTGTGKSALINALVGSECSRSGRQRPTTTRPVLLAHSDTPIEELGLPLDEFETHRIESALLRDMILIDCPDPDTSEDSANGTNLAMLRKVLPLCDILLCTSTQQKYRSAAVSEELLKASQGCRLIFVQTHAALDVDIREDWRESLGNQFDVPELFFLDSLAALQEKQAGRRPTGDFARLEDRLTGHRMSSERILIRRANLVDLVEATLESCLDDLHENEPAVNQLRTVLLERSNQLTRQLADQLNSELMTSQNLWERRLLNRVTSLWGFSPFSTVLRFYDGLGAYIASFSFFRARTPAQMALIGAMQTKRWIQSRNEQREAETKVDRLSNLTIDESLLSETHLVIAGYLRDARITDSRSLAEFQVDDIRRQTAFAEQSFFNDAGRRVDELIERQAVGHSGFLIRCWYEFLFLVYLAFILFRIGRNFFYDTFLVQFISDSPVKTLDLLSVDFYIPAALFFLLWSGGLVMAFTRRLRRGLKREIGNLSAQLSEHRFPGGLLPNLEQQCDAYVRRREELGQLSSLAEELKNTVSAPDGLGARHAGTGSA